MLMLGGDLLYEFSGRAVWNTLSEVIPADILLGAEIWTVEELLEAEDL
jgi:hypothetical protein